MRVKIGDVVDKIVGDEDRFNTDLEYYVGGEHISSERIKIYNKGLLNSDKGKTLGYQFHYPFRSRDVLFMTKNPYLKKCGMVDFDGICSIATFVMRSKDEGVLIQEYLALVMQTSEVWNYLEANKSGSVNYFITWKTLEKYEFELPSIEEQKKIAEVAWQFEELRASYEKLIIRTDELVKSQFIEMFGDPVDNPFGWPTKGLTELGSCKNGMNFGARDQGVTIQSVGVGDIKDYDYIESIAALTTLSLNEMPTEEYLLKDGDLVFVRSNGNKNLVGRCVAIYPHEVPVTFSGFCIRFRKESDDVLLDYLLRYLKMPEVRAKMAGRGANIQNLNQKILAALQVPVPPLDKQSEYAAFIKQSDKSKFEIKEAMKNLVNSFNAFMKENVL